MFQSCALSTPIIVKRTVQNSPTVVPKILILIVITEHDSQFYFSGFYNKLLSLPPVFLKFDINSRTRLTSSPKISYQLWAGSPLQIIGNDSNFLFI